MSTTTTTTAPTGASTSTTIGISTNSDANRPSLFCPRTSTNPTSPPKMIPTFNTDGSLTLTLNRDDADYKSNMLSGSSIRSLSYKVRPYAYSTGQGWQVFELFAECDLKDEQDGLVKKEKNGNRWLFEAPPERLKNELDGVVESTWPEKTNFKQSVQNLDDTQWLKKPDESGAHYDQSRASWLVKL